MSASIGSNGCLNWQGKVGIVPTDDPNLDKLRVGKISYSPQANLFMLYTGNGRNEKPETSFEAHEVSDVALYALKDTVCTFKLKNTKFKNKKFCIAIDFKGSLDPGNRLRPNEKAKTFCEFLLKLTNGAKSATAVPMKNGCASKRQLSTRNADSSFSTMAKRRKDEQANIFQLTTAMNSRKRGKRSQLVPSANSGQGIDNADLSETNATPSKVWKDDDYSSVYSSLRSRIGNSTTNSIWRNRSSPSGLANMGNTCYMNSVLQAAFIIDSLSTRLFESLKFFQKEALNPSVFIERYLPLMKALSNLLNNRCCGGNLAVFLKSVHGCVSAAVDKFRNNRQEDAHEFLMDMLSQLQSEFNEAVKQLNGRAPLMMQKTDPIRLCFGYTMRRIFTCEKCNFESSVEEENTNFIVHISDERLKSHGFNFADILRDSMAVEIVEHECDSCGHRSASMKPEFVRLPEHFIFVIRRYLYNQQNGNKHKLHAKVSMHKYITLVTTDTLPQRIPVEQQKKLATGNEAEKKSKGSKTVPKGIDNRWRDRTINRSNIGFMIEDTDEEIILKNVFDQLREQCKNTTSNKARVTPVQDFKEDVSDVLGPLIYALTAGNESLYVKLKEMIWSNLTQNAELFVEMTGKSEKAFRDYVTKVKKNDLPSSNLEIFALASIFEVVLIVLEDDKWISYAPKSIIRGDEKKLINSKHSVLKNKFFMPKNVSYLASTLHPRRSKSYCLSSVVCHVGQSTEGGHYKCAVQTDGGWSICNDDVITNSHEKTVLEKSGESGYILFYTACKDRSVSPKRERIDELRKH